MILGGGFQNLVELRPAGATTTEASSKAAPKPRRKAAGGRKGYVASGRFKEELVSVLGKYKKRAGRPRPRAAGLDEALAHLPAGVAAELEALHDLYAASMLPDLGGLREGAWCPIPAQYGLDAEGVLESEWFDDPADAELLCEAVEILNDQGSPFIIVGAQGVYAFYEDPHAYVQIADRLEDFLRALLALEAAIRGQISVAAAEETLAETLYVTEDDDYVSFVERLLAQARKRKTKS